MARGDQIYAMRELMNISGVYEHHGIDCGDGTVIHYRKPSETIERTSLEIFSQGQRIYVKPYAIRYIADTTIYRAESRLGEREYNLLFNNCEHFATWCVTGINDSKQIRDFLPSIQNINIDQLTKPLREAILGGKTEQSATLIGEAL
ncbi:MAG: lecithin retinol acyltransferase family protein, partial [Microcoleaceae cyanobacterium]